MSRFEATIVGYTLPDGRLYCPECVPLTLTQLNASRLPKGVRAVWSRRGTNDARRCHRCTHRIHPMCGWRCTCGATSNRVRVVESRPRVRPKE